MHWDLNWQVKTHSLKTTRRLGIFSQALSSRLKICQTFSKIDVQSEESLFLSNGRILQLFCTLVQFQSKQERRPMKPGPIHLNNGLRHSCIDLHYLRCYPQLVKMCLESMIWFCAIQTKQKWKLNQYLSFVLWA